MHRNSNLYERIAALPLGSRDREHALRSLSSAEAFIDIIAWREPGSPGGTRAGSDGPRPVQPMEGIVTCAM
jgi:hypothetical protein